MDLITRKSENKNGQYDTKNITFYRSYFFFI